jgi:hypothetical protein
VPECFYLCFYLLRVRRALRTISETDTQGSGPAVLLVRAEPKLEEFGIMRSLRATVAALVALAAVVGSMVVTTSSAAARPEPGAREGPRGCSAQDYLGRNDVLRLGRALCNGNYLLRMQENGDLVLREISTGRACWHSRTFVPGVSATLLPGAVDPRGPAGGGASVPTLRVGSRDFPGTNTPEHLGTTANLNSEGELWVGYGKVATCGETVDGIVPADND